jgi:hypothetical protein
MSKWTFFLDYQAWMDDRRLFIQHTTQDGQRSIVQPFQAAPVERGQRYDIATLSESRADTDDLCGDVTNFLQAALECAWEQGLRPKGFADHANELSATRAHLEDMRSLALKIPPPERLGAKS